MAAGNSALDIYGGDGKIGNGNEYIPAAYPEVLTVSAMTDQDGVDGGLRSDSSSGPDDSMAGFSNYGKAVVSGNPVSSSGASVDVAAPGTFVYSTFSNGGYMYGAGTSFAAPHATGAIALLAASQGRATSAAGVAMMRQQLIDAGSAMDSWRPDDADINSDPDSKHEPLLDVSDIAVGDPAPEPTPEPAPEPTPTPPPPTSQLVVDVSADKAGYANRDTAYVDVWVTSNAGPVSGTNVTLTLTGAKGKVRTFSSVSGDDGSASFKIKINYRSTGCGIYTIVGEATLDGYEPGDATSQFTVC